MFPLDRCRIRDDLSPHVDGPLELFGDRRTPRDLYLPAAADRRREEVLAIHAYLDRLTGIAIHGKDDVMARKLGSDGIS